jgi:hypothetical protein
MDPVDPWHVLLSHSRMLREIGHLKLADCTCTFFFCVGVAAPTAPSDRLKVFSSAQRHPSHVRQHGAKKLHIGSFAAHESHRHAYIFKPISKSYKKGVRRGGEEKVMAISIAAAVWKGDLQWEKLVPHTDATCKRGPSGGKPRRRATTRLENRPECDQSTEIKIAGDVCLCDCVKQNEDSFVASQFQRINQDKGEQPLLTGLGSDQ